MKATLRKVSYFFDNFFHRSPGPGIGNHVIGVREDVLSCAHLPQSLGFLDYFVQVIGEQHRREYGPLW